MDTYHCLDDLSLDWCENQDFRALVKERESDILIVAPHGGGIEPGTSEVAIGLAGQDFSYYCFEGLMETGNRLFHIESQWFDDARCISMFSKARVALIVHGCTGYESRIYVGGRSQVLKYRLIDVLRVCGFNAVFDCTHHAGLHPHSLCNRLKSGQGIQLELSWGLRASFFQGLSRSGRRIMTPIYDHFVRAVRSLLLEF
jgi:phage replication-related protein YjqB (UPF0714/DUF867 family)